MRKEFVVSVRRTMLALNVLQLTIDRRNNGRTNSSLNLLRSISVVIVPFTLKAPTWNRLRLRSMTRFVVPCCCLS